MGIIVLFKLSKKCIYSTKTHFLKKFFEEILISILYLNAKSVEQTYLAIEY